MLTTLFILSHTQKDDLLALQLGILWGRLLRDPTKARLDPAPSCVKRGLFKH